MDLMVKICWLSSTLLQHCSTLQFKILGRVIRQIFLMDSPHNSSCISMNVRRHYSWSATSKKQLMISLSSLHTIPPMPMLSFAVVLHIKLWAMYKPQPAILRLPSSLTHTTWLFQSTTKRSMTLNASYFALPAKKQLFELRLPRNSKCVGETSMLNGRQCSPVVANPGSVTRIPAPTWTVARLPQYERARTTCELSRMGNAACTSCCWWRGSHSPPSSKNPGEHKKTDDEWFDGSSVPLVAARFDDEINTESVVKKTVVLRAARPASPSVSEFPPGQMSISKSPRTTHRGSRADEDDVRHSHRSPSPRKASPMASSSPIRKTSSPDRRHQSTGIRSLGLSTDDEASLPAIGFDGESSERMLGNDGKQDSERLRHRESSSGERKESNDAVATPRSRGHSYNDEHHRNSLEDDDDQEEVKQEKLPSTHSPRSTRSASQDSTSTTNSTGTPKRKARYGRKNYRANSNRKKTR